MQPWQGNPDILIDRYDVRSHIDFIPESQKSSKSAESDTDEGKCYYERYRILVQNECASVTEEQCLHQIYLDEQFGSMEAASKKADEDKKKAASKKVAIGYTYEDTTPAADPNNDEDEDDDDEESSDEEIDLDNILDIDLLTKEQEQLLNMISTEYGMKGKDYSDFLQLDRDEAEALRTARQLEEEKAQFSGRKSRRERRAFKEKRMKDRKLSPPSYAAVESPKPQKLEKLRTSSSRSRSKSQEAAGVVQFITSFGGESADEGVVHGPALPPYLQKKSKTHRSQNSKSRSPIHRDSCRISRNRNGSRSFRSRSRSPARGRTGRSRRSRSHSRSRRSRSHSQSRSRRVTRSPDRDRWMSGRRSRDRYGGRSLNTDSRRSGGYRSGNDNWWKESRDSSKQSRGVRSRSRTRTRATSRSRSRSNLKSRSRSLKSQSKSPTPCKGPQKLSSPPLKTYRRASLSESSNSEFEDEGSETGDKKSVMSKSDASSKRSDLMKGLLSGKMESVSAKSKLTPQERLKKKMQLALSKQYKADKRAEFEKHEKEEQMKVDREEELRAIAIQMRQRERERRHKEREEVERLDQERSRGERDYQESRSGRRSRSRSRSSSASRPKSYRDRDRDRRHRSRSGSESSKSSNKPKLVDY